MYTACPMCSTLLQVSPEQLAMKHGMVRCGRCQEVFDATDHCHEEAERALPANDGGGPQAPPALSQVGALNEAPALGQSETAEAGPVADAEGPRPEQPGPLPWEQMPTSSASMSRARFGLWSTALLALLAVQVWHFEAKQILHSPSLRYYLEPAAGAVGLTLPLYEDRAALSIISRELRPHPDQGDALRFRLTIQNLSPYRQSYPVVRLSLNDQQQHVVARATVQPLDYLSQAQVDRGLDPQSIADVTIDFIEPQGAVDGFLFELL